MRFYVDMLAQSLNWQDLPDLAAWVIEEAVTIQQIPAPTFAESQRAAHVAQRFADLGLVEITTDEVFNVYGLFPGQNRTVPGLMLMAHTDTIFPAETDLAIRRADDVIYGPGLGDNSIGVAGMLGLARLLHDRAITPPCDIWFVATSREEGLGDLGGVKTAFAHLRPRIASVINLEGLAFGHVYHAGINVRRLRITARTTGGHSWLHFGRASAIHTLVQLGARITALQPPQYPRTTYNIGMIEGGQAINALATSASLWLDLRSEEREALAGLEAQVMDEIEALNNGDVTFEVEIVGDRPAGIIPPGHPLVQGAVAALNHAGVRAALESGSTDANIPLSQGCPAVTIGITRGGNAHRLDEYVETRPVTAGMRQFITLALAAAAHHAEQEPLVS